MAEAFSNPAGSSSVSVLFHPSTVPVIDVFRSLRALESQYDLAVLDGPEQALMAYARPELAKAIISDALLLAFALTRKRGQPLCHQPLKSRHGSLDEYCLMALIGSARSSEAQLAMEAAAALKLGALDYVSSLAGELAKQLSLSSLIFGPPSLSEFRAVMGDRLPYEDLVRNPRNSPDFHFRF